jgi:glycosyltransferase involved in cell wall biosynthesis
VPPELTVLIPMLDEVDNIDPLLDRLAATLRGASWECVVVDDGSTDGTWERLQQRPVRSIRHPRNLGQQRAWQTGLAHARGRVVVTMDADLQHPPEVIPRLLRAWRSGAVVVWTRRYDTSQRAGRRWASRAFYRAYSSWVGTELPAGSSDFLLFERHLLTGDDIVFLRGQLRAQDVAPPTVHYVAPPRAHGETSYPWHRSVSLAVAALRRAR